MKFYHTLYISFSIYRALAEEGTQNFVVHVQERYSILCNWSHRFHWHAKILVTSGLETVQPAQMCLIKCIKSLYLYLSRNKTHPLIPSPHTAMAPVLSRLVYNMQYTNLQCEFQEQKPAGPCGPLTCSLRGCKSVKGEQKPADCRGYSLNTKALVHVGASEGSRAGINLQTTPAQHREQGVPANPPHTYIQHIFTNGPHGEGHH